MKSHKQLIYEQRCQIHALKKTGISQNAISNIVGVSQPTISRELKRNTGLNEYRHQQAQRLGDQRRRVIYRAFKMTPERIEKLVEKRSPEQISGWLLTEKGYSLSHETIYRHVWKNKESKGVLTSKE